MKGKKTCIHEMCVYTYLLPFEPRLWQDIKIIPLFHPLDSCMCAIEFDLESNLNIYIIKN